MDRKKLLLIIQKDLSELNEIAGELAKGQEAANYEIDFAIGKARIVLQELEILKGMCRTVEPQAEITFNTDAEPKITAENTETVKQVEVAFSDSIEETCSDGIEVAYSHSIEETCSDGIEVAYSHSIEETCSDGIEETPVASAQVPEEHRKGAESSIVAEFLQQEKPLNDIIEEYKKTLDQKLATAPLARLDDAIGLNDRFQFTRELFNNDADIFKKTITKLDRMSSLEEAVEYLNSNFKWVKNDTSLKFAKLVKRRFTL